MSRPDSPGAGRLKKTWKDTLEQHDGRNDKPDTQQEQQPHGNTPCTRGRKEVSRQRDFTALRTEPFKKGADGYKQAAHSPGGEFLR